MKFCSDGIEEFNSPEHRTIEQREASNVSSVGKGLKGVK